MLYWRIPQIHIHLQTGMAQSINLPTRSQFFKNPTLAKKNNPLDPIDDRKD